MPDGMMREVRKVPRKGTMGRKKDDVKRRV